MKKIFILFVCMFFTVIILSGCNARIFSNTAKAEKAVISMLETLKSSSDIEELKKYVNDVGTASSAKSNDAGMLIYQHMTYRILSSHEEDENTVRVNTEISSLNFQDILKEMMKPEYLNNLKSDEDYMNALTKILDSGNIDTVVSTVEIEVKNYSGQWKVSSIDTALEKALAGAQ